jgi:TonB family protein
MNTARSGRSRGFWLGGFLFLFLIHALAIFVYGEREKALPPRKQIEPFLHIGGDSATDEQLAKLTGWRDPTLFALPHPQGFSGSAWLKFQPETPARSNWTAPPEWLPLPVAQLGETLHEFVTTNRRPEETLLSSLRVPKTLEARLPGEPALTKTSIRISGPLAARRLIRTPELPGIAHHDVVKTTVVALAVNGEGVVESASVSGPSGSPQADERALELALQFEFQPLALREVRARETASPTLGRVIFTWQLLPPTNGVSSASTLP